MFTDMTPDAYRAIFEGGDSPESGPAPQHCDMTPFRREIERMPEVRLLAAAERVLETAEAGSEAHDLAEQVVEYLDDTAFDRGASEADDLPF